MRRFILIGALAASLPIAATAAEPASPHTFTGNVGFVSDYRFRGVSQTWTRPAIQGGFDYAHSNGFYLGTWGSNVSGNSFTNGNMEWDFYGGYSGKINDALSYNVGLLQYYYPGAKTSATPPSKEYDTLEFYGGVTYKWLNVKYSHTLSDYFGISNSTGAALPFNFITGVADAANGNSKGSGYLELNASYELADKLTLVGHIGHQKVKHYSNLNYTDYKIGITKEFNGFVFGLAYIDTDAKNEYFKLTANGETEELSKGTAVLSVSKSF